jgi:hypothetical protein
MRDAADTSGRRSRSTSTASIPAKEASVGVAGQSSAEDDFHLVDIDKHSHRVRLLSSYLQLRQRCVLFTTVQTRVL